MAASRFVEVTDEEISEIKINSIQIKEEIEWIMHGQYLWLHAPNLIDDLSRMNKKGGTKC
jgi:hypothetical protein